MGCWPARPGTFFTYRRGGASPPRPEGHAIQRGGQVASGALDAHLRTSEKPLGAPCRPGPAPCRRRSSLPVRILLFSTAPTAKSPPVVFAGGVHARASRRFRRRSAPQPTARSPWRCHPPRRRRCPHRACRRQMSPGRTAARRPAPARRSLMAARSMPTVSCMFHSKPAWLEFTHAVRCRSTPVLARLGTSTARQSRQCQPARPRAWSFGQGFDALDQRVARVDVNASVFVAGQGGSQRCSCKGMLWVREGGGREPQAGS